MDENAKKLKKINRLIPKLLEQSNKYKKVFKNKNKMNNIFTEFEIKSSHHFNFFVKESINRYKNMKLGNDLNKLMSNSEKRRTTEVNRVLNDDFFSNNIIKQEKKNSKYYTSDKIYKNLKKTIKLLKDSSSDKAHYYLNDITNEKTDKTKSILEEEKDNIQEPITSKEKLNREKEDINKVFMNEESKIEKMFNKYREDVNILQQIGEKSKEKYATMHKKIELALPKLEMINYEHYEPPKNIEKDVEVLQRKTLDKIMPFTKYYKQGNKNNKRNKSNNNDLKVKKIFKRLILNNNPMLDAKLTTLNNIKLRKIDMNDTNDVVLNTAYKELTANNFINDKRRKLTEILAYDVPKIENYRNIMKNKFKQIKNERNEINHEKLKLQKYAAMSHNDKLNLKIYNELYLLTQVEKDWFKKPNENK